MVDQVLARGIQDGGLYRLFANIVEKVQQDTILVSFQLRGDSFNIHCGISDQFHACG